MYTYKCIYIHMYISIEIKQLYICIGKIIFTNPITDNRMSTHVCIYIIFIFLCLAKLIALLIFKENRSKIQG